MASRIGAHHRVKEPCESCRRAAPALIWMSDADKRCTYVNAAWMAFTGRPLEAVLADGWREAIHPDDLPRCLEVLDAAFEGHQPYTLEYRFRRRTTANIDGFSIAAFRYWRQTDRRPATSDQSWTSPSASGRKNRCAERNPS